MVPHVDGEAHARPSFIITLVPSFTRSDHEELTDIQPRIDLDTNYNSRSATMQVFERPQTELRLDGNHFAPGFLGGIHAVKFGTSYRSTPSLSAAHTGGFTTARYRNGVGIEANLTRDSASRTGMRSARTSRTHSARDYLNMGVRADYQDDEARASSIPPHPIIPELLPAIDFQGADSGVEFLDISPRLGATWDLRRNGKTLLKGSAAQYYGTGISTSGTINPVGSTTLRYPWTDGNSDGFVQRSELDLTRLLNFSNNYNPANPNAFVTPNTVDPGLKNDRTDELLGAFEHELMPDFGISVTYMWRSYPRYSNWTPLGGVSSADYVPVTATFACGNATCDQPGYTVTYWQLPFQLPASGVLRNQDQRRSYQSVDISARKRYRDRWLLNASLTLQDTRIHYGPADRAYQDPTNVAQQDGAKAGTLNADWSASSRGCIRFPGCERLRLPQHAPGLSVQSHGPVPVAQRRTRSGRRDGRQLWRHATRELLPAGRARRKSHRGAGQAALSVGRRLQRAERQHCSCAPFRQNAANANDAQEILAPRVARFGVRFTF